MKEAHWGPAQVVKDDPAVAVPRIKSGSGGDLVVFDSATHLY